MRGPGLVQIKTVRTDDQTETGRETSTLPAEQLSPFVVTDPLVKTPLLPLPLVSGQLPGEPVAQSVIAYWMSGTNGKDVEELDPPDTLV